MSNQLLHVVMLAGRATVYLSLNAYDKLILPLASTSMAHGTLCPTWNSKPQKLGVKLLHVLTPAAQIHVNVIFYILIGYIPI